MTTGMVLVRAIAFDLLEHLHPVHFRQFQIQQYQLRRMIKGPSGMRSGAEQEIQRFLAVTGHEDTVGQILRAQGMQGEIHVVLTIIDQKNVDFSWRS